MVLRKALKNPHIPFIFFWNFFGRRNLVRHPNCVKRGSRTTFRMSGPDAKCLRFFVFCLRTVRDFRVFVHEKEVAQKKNAKKKLRIASLAILRNKLRIRGKHLKAV